MTFADTFKALPEQYLDLLSVTQEMVLTNASAAMATAKSFAPPADAIPFADKLPNPGSISDSLFDFAEKVLTSQKDFSRKFLDIYAPPRPSATTAKVATAKSA